MFAAITHPSDVSQISPKVNRSRRWHREHPYNDLPLLPPRTDVETKAVLRQCIPARAALARLKQAAELIPNQAVLINSLPVLEARASSEIENIVTTTDRLFQFQHSTEGQEADPATKEALRYRGALMHGFRTLAQHPVNTRTAEEICSAITGTTVRVRRVRGTALASSQTGRVTYTPPEGEDTLRAMLANRERFLHETVELDPLIRMAVAHYQFEAIHPFSDGNGRTGRVLNSLFLIQSDLLSLPILYLSRHIIAHKADYYRLLLAVTERGEWEAWLLFLLKGVEETADWTTGKIAAIRALEEHTVAYVRKAAPKLYTRELVDALFELPYCRIKNLTQRGVGTRQTASRYLQSLAQLGVLEARAVGREKLFIHPKLLKLLSRDSNSFVPYA